MKKITLIALGLAFLPVNLSAADTYTIVGERITTEKAGTQIKTTTIYVPNLATLEECNQAIYQLKSLRYVTNAGTPLGANTNMIAACVKITDPNSLYVDQSPPASSN